MPADDRPHTWEDPTFSWSDDDAYERVLAEMFEREAELCEMLAEAPWLPEDVAEVLAIPPVIDPG